MTVFSLALSRLVPLLFVASAVLVAGRFLYERYRGARPWLARVLFAAILGLGVLGGTPYVLRSTLLVAAETRFEMQDWTGADREFALYARLGGRLGPKRGADWASALMNLRAWPQAEAVLLSGVERGDLRQRGGGGGAGAKIAPNSLYLLGVCRYFDGRFDAAERTLAAVGAGPFFLRQYLLGRLAERRGDLARARDAYRQALAANPALFPAVYQAARLALAGGDPAAASALLDRFEAGPAGGDPAKTAGIRQALASHSQLPDVEFEFLQMD
jgi:tetratricopeptide (TPR) repeat protein